MTKEMISEYTLRISEANRTQMVEILYELLLEYISEAESDFENKAYDAFSADLEHAVAVVRELSASINTESKLSGTFFSLYIFISKELTLSGVKRNIDTLKRIRPMIEKLRDAYSELAKRDGSVSLMSNSEKVYAGLTYGKESLIVHINGQNRGITV